MSMNRKLKLAILCAALSGVTVACTKDKDNNQTLAVAPKGQVEAEVEAKDFTAPAKTAGDNLADQLMVLANQKEDCSKTSDIMADAQIQKMLINGQDTVVSAREGTRFLSEKIEAESDPYCQIDVIAEVSQKMFETHVRTGVYPKTAEQKEMSLSKVEAFLAGIQPILKKVRGLVKIKRNEVFSDTQVAEKNAELGEKEATLVVLVGELESLASCDGTNCSQKSANAQNAANSAKATLASVDDQLKKVDDFKAGPGNVGFIAIRDGMMDDIINSIDVEINKAKAVIAAQ